MAATLNELLIEIQDLTDKLESLGFGDAATSVTHKGITRPALQKAIADKFNELSAMVGGNVPFKTVALLQSSGAPSADVNGNYPMAFVWGDASISNNGLYAWDNSIWVKSDYDVINAVDGANLLFDPLNQFVTDYPNINGFGHLYGVPSFDVQGNIFSADGKALVSGVNGGRVNRNFPIPENYLGKAINFVVYAEFDVDCSFILVFRDAQGAPTYTYQSPGNPHGASGFLSFKQVVPAGSASVTVILEPSVGKVKAHFYGAAFNGIPRPFETLNPAEMIAKSAVIDNILFDPFNKFAQVTNVLDNFKFVQRSGFVADSVNSSVLTPVVTSDPLNGTFERLYEINRANLSVGDSFNLKISVWSESGCTIKIHFRTDYPSLAVVGGPVSVRTVAAGFVDEFYESITVPASGAALSIIVDYSAGQCELISCLASRTGVPASSEVVATPAEIAGVAAAVGSSLVVDGQLSVNSEVLSPVGLFVESAHEVSAGLWEFIAKGLVYRVLESNPGVAICVPESGFVTPVMIAGQSLAMGDSSGATVDPVVDMSAYDGRMLMPGGFPSQGPGETLLNLSSIEKLTQLHNYPASRSPARSAVFQALKSGIDATFLVLSHGIGGKTLAYLRDGNSFKNGEVQIQSAKALVESYGLKIDPRVFIIWNQGEADGGSDTYYSDLNGLIDLYKTMIATYLGTEYSMTFLVDQVARSYTKKPAIAQYRVCEDREDAVMILAKAHLLMKYNMHAETGNSDYTHPSKRGYFFMGSYWGKTLYSLMQSGSYSSLDQRSVTIDGSLIHIDFSVGDSRLIHDPVIDVPNFGFGYSDSLGSTIISSEIVSKDRVTLTMSSDVSAASSRVLDLGLITDATAQYKGSSLRTSSRLFIPEMGEYLHDWALCWEKGI